MLIKRASGLVALLLLLAIGYCSRGGDAAPRAADAVAAEDPDRTLRDLLLRLHRTWQPAAQARILEEAEDRRHELEEPLRRALAGSELLREAIAVAASTRLAALRPALEALCGEGVADQVRHDAIIAAESISSWSDEAIGELLEGPPIAQLAALEVMSAHHDGPWLLVVALLGTQVDELRRAALAAIPEQLPPDALSALCRLVTAGTEEETAIALAALERTTLDDGRRAELAAHLPRLGPPQQIAALRVLAEHAMTDAVREAVWRLVRDVTAVEAVRGCALWCLEQTDGFTVPEIREVLPSLYERSRYFAARCLLRAGERDGAGLLLDLVEVEDPEVGNASRWLLAALTGRSPGSPASAFAAALEDGATALPQVAIPPAPNAMLAVPAEATEATEATEAGEAGEAGEGGEAGVTTPRKEAALPQAAESDPAAPSESVPPRGQ